MSVTTSETGAAIENIAWLSASVAEGASRQIVSIEAAETVNREAARAGETGRGFAAAAGVRGDGAVLGHPGDRRLQRRPREDGGLVAGPGERVPRLTRFS